MWVRAKKKKRRNWIKTPGKDSVSFVPFRQLGIVRAYGTYWEVILTKRYYIKQIEEKIRGGNFSNGGGGDILNMSTVRWR